MFDGSDQLACGTLNTCSECGAPATAELNCQTGFDECLALEFTSAEFFAVHHLMVATFMLQHSSKLSREGWLAMRQLLREILVENKSPQEMRKQNKSAVNSGNRKWKIPSISGAPIIGCVPWAKTILDVRRESAEPYCADIAAWARASLADAAGLEPE